MEPPLEYKKVVLLVGRWSLYFTEVEINCTNTIIIGTRPSGLYREVVTG